MHILFVDDAVDTRDLFCLSFAIWGHTTRTAQDGEEALHILTQQAETVDVVIMDQNMRGLNGLEVVQQLRQQDSTRGIPIILFTGEVAEGFERQALDCGVARVVYKPIVPSALMATVQEVVNPAETAR